MCGKEHYDENFSHHCTKVRHIAFFPKKLLRKKDQEQLFFFSTINIQKKYLNLHTYLYVYTNNPKTMKKFIYLIASACLIAFASCGSDNKKAEETPAPEEQKDTLAVERDTFPADRWMEENKLKEGVVEANGIQYKVLEEGKGDKPNKRKRVKMNFDLRLTNGKVVESHWGKDVMELAVSNVIPGLQNALTQMPEGSTWEIYVPWQLGYGEEGSKNIPPHSALIFKVKLIEVVKLK